MSSKGEISEGPEYSVAMRRLMEAAQKLRDAAHAMAQQKPSPDRDKAIQQTYDALLETQRAIFELPIDLRYASPSGSNGTHADTHATANKNHLARNPPRDD